MARARRWRWIAAVGTALLVTGAAVVGLGLAVATGQLPGATRVLLAWGLSRATGVEVRIGGFAGSLLGRFELEDVAVGPPAWALRARSLRVELGPVDLESRSVVVRSLEIDGLEVTVRRDAQGDWQVSGLSAPGADDASAPASPGAAEPSLTLELETLVVRDAGLDVAWTPTSSAAGGSVRGRLDGRATGLRWPAAAGSPGAWPRSLAAELRLAAARVEGRAFERGRLTLRLDGSASPPTLALDVDALEGAAGRLAGTARAGLVGTWTEPGLARADADLRVEALDLATLLGGAAPPSSLHGETSLSWDGRTLAGSVTVAPSRLAGAAVRGARVQGRVVPATWSFAVESARLDADFAQLDASGEGDARAASALHVRAARVDFDALPEAWRLEPPLHGTLAGEAELAGPWRDLRGDVSLRARDFGRDDWGRLDGAVSGRVMGKGRLRIASLDVTPRDRPQLAFAALAPFELTLRDGSARLQDARLRVAGGTLRLDGGVDREHLRDLRLGASDLDLATLLASIEADVAAGGRVDGDLRLDGPVDRPRMQGEIVWRAPQLEGLEAQRAVLALAPSAEGEPAVDARLVLERDGREAVALEARVPTRDLLLHPGEVLTGPRVSGSVRLADLEVAWIAPLLPESLPSVGGALDGRIRVRGPLADPVLAGELDWRAPRWGDLSAQRLALSVAPSEPGRPLELSATLHVEGREALRARLDLPERERLARPRALLDDPDARLLLVFDGLDLAWLAPRAADEGGLHLRGRLEGRVTLTGGSPAPSANGELQVADLRASGPPLSGELGPAHAVLRLEGREAQLVTLRLPAAPPEGGEPGEARLWGRIAWERWRDPHVDLQLALTRFPLDQPGVLSGRLDGDVSIQGRLESLRARGGVLLHDADVELPETEDPLMREIRVEGLPPKEEPASIFEGREGGWMEGLEADLEVRLGDRVWLRGMGAELELEGDLRIRKPKGGKPGLYGGVEVASGRVLFRGKPLRVEEGSAVFDGSAEPDPYLDATAVHRVRDVTIYVRLFGRASDLNVELTSDPAMSPEDRLSYLLFDRPVGELGSDQQASLGTAAGVLAADVLLGEFGAGVVESVGLDRVRVALDEQSAPTLELEKQLNDRIRVRYGRSFGANGGDRFVVEWRLFRHLFLSGEQSTSGESGVDLLWRLDY